MDKPLSQWTLEEIQTRCNEQTYCFGCPCYTEGKGCLFTIFSKNLEWPQNTEIGGQPIAADTNVGHKPAKPRLAEVLGVDVGEKVRIIGGSFHTLQFCIEETGYPNTDVCAALVYAINHPESIIRAPRLTEAELAICKAVGAKWVSRNKVGGNSLHLWNKKPEGNNGCYFNGNAVSLATVAEELFPSVHPGDCINVEEAGGDA